MPLLIVPLFIVPLLIVPVPEVTPLGCDAVGPVVPGVLFPRGLSPWGCWVCAPAVTASAPNDAMIKPRISCCRFILIPPLRLEVEVTGDRRNTPAMLTRFPPASAVRGMLVERPRTHHQRCAFSR